VIDSYKTKIEDIEKRLTIKTDKHRIAKLKAELR